MIKVVSHRKVAIKITSPWFTAVPSGRALIAAPVAKGLIVDPSTPDPAPSKTTAEPTNGSIPAAIIVAASKT